MDPEMSDVWDELLAAGRLDMAKFEQLSFEILGEWRLAIGEPREAKLQRDE